MREFPVLFTGPNVRAILQGRKTQTRRIIIHQPPPDADEVFFWEQPDPSSAKTAPTGFWARNNAHDGYLRFLERSPWGIPGDRLWVRENFYVQPELWARNHELQPLHYAADIGNRAEVEDYVLKPSIFMPRWASRLLLENKAIRAERLRAISEEDAKAEGIERRVEHNNLVHVEDFSGNGIWTSDPRIAFQLLWDSINARRGFGWDVNPWVWVIEFQMLDGG